ncbi:MAG: response regulator transcription factor [Gammaproteobacteria bacterium]
MRLLLVEDDRLIGSGVQDVLQDEGYAVDWVRDGKSALEQVATGVHDLVILDLGLPQMDGMDVLREVRARQSKVPVLILSARDAPTSRVAGLDAGADDYLVKPFDLNELSARIRALLRRGSGRADSVITHRGVVLNPVTYRVTVGGQDISLPAREFHLLHALLENPGAVLSRDQLREKLYSWGEEIESNTIEVFVHSLRKRLGADYIITVRGVGYAVISGP